MGIEYSVIEIFTSEEARYRGKPVPEAVIEMVRKKKIAARCMVTKGTAACYENGEQVTQRIVALSFNMPIKIEIVLPAAEKDAIVAAVVEMTTEGIVGIRDLHVHRHQTRNHLIPRHFLVEAAMTSQPEKVYAHTSLADVIQLLLPAFFTGLPVVNADDTPIGIITHGDLVYRAGLPIRPGLLKSTGENNLTGILDSLRAKTATEIMSSPVTTIEASKPLTAAVEIMLNKRIKRLPVVDAKGRLIGMLSRFDVFKIISNETPNWKALGHPDVVVADQKTVADIMQREIKTVTPDTGVDHLIRIIDSEEIQRVAVVDDEGKFLGMISDGDLLAVFLDRHPGVIEHFASLLPGIKRIPFGSLPLEKLKHETASGIMQTNLTTVTETTGIEEAIRMMTENGLKRLPVLDGNGNFRGMISRDSLLRTGYRPAK